MGQILEYRNSQGLQIFGWPNSRQHEQVWATYRTCAENDLTPSFNGVAFRHRSSSKLDDRSPWDTFRVIKDNALSGHINTNV